MPNSEQGQDRFNIESAQKAQNNWFHNHSLDQLWLHILFILHIFFQLFFVFIILHFGYYTLFHSRSEIVMKKAYFCLNNVTPEYWTLFV